MNDMTQEREIQEQCRAFVEREVLVRQNEAVECMGARDECFFFEQVENCEAYKCPHCGEGLPQEMPAPSSEHEEQGHFFTCPHCSEPFNDPESEYQEVYEWWAVTDYLGEKLADKGQPIYRGQDCIIWGRCCTGQAILLDGVIREIVSEL